MMRFAVNDKTDSLFSGDTKARKSFELSRFGKDEFILFGHQEGNAEEIYTFTKEELKLLWLMLTTNE